MTLKNRYYFKPLRFIIYRHHNLYNVGRESRDSNLGDSSIYYTPNKTTEFSIIYKKSASIF